MDDEARNKEITRRIYEEAWSKGDLSVVDEITAPDFACANTTVSPDSIRRGADFIKASVRGWRAAFPDIRATVEDQLAEGDRVAVRFTISGTHEGEIYGVPPTGNRMRLTGISIFRIVDGVFMQAWGAGDMLELLRQLDAAPVAEAYVVD